MRHVCDYALTGAQVVPPTQCTDPAVAYLFANFETMFLRLRIEHAVTNATAIHIHAEDGTLLKDFGNPAQPYDYVLSPADLEALEEAAYFDIHSSAYPDGAVRGWFDCASDPEPVTLTLGVVGDGGTSPPPGAHEYQLGEQFWVNAYTDWHSEFTHWTGDLPEGANPSIAELEVPMTQDRALTAHFDRTHWRLTTQMEGQGTIYPGPGDSWYPLGNTVALSASPGDHWRFLEWDLDWSGGSESIEQPYTDWTMNADTTATAIFDDYVYRLTVYIAGGTLETGTTNPAPGPYYFDEGGEPFSITAIPQTGYVFDKWYGDLPQGADPDALTLTGYMTQDREIVARFMPENSTVPYLIGATQLQAQTSLLVAGLLLGSVTFDYSDTIGEDLVMAQDPVTGTVMPFESSVNITLSLGPCLVTAPDVTGLDLSAATAAIEGANLTLGQVTEAYDYSVAEGLVIHQTPTGGGTASCGAPVDLVVSLGPCLVTVPDLFNLTLAEAEAALTAAGLQVGVVTEAHHPTVPVGRVYYQLPAAGSQAPCGLATWLFLSLGPCMTDVPDVSLLTEEDATAALVAADLTVGDVSEEISETVPAGRVIEQDPAPEAHVGCDSPVDLVVSLGDIVYGEYVPGCDIVSTWTLEYTGDPLRALGVTIELPDGWTLEDFTVPSASEDQRFAYPLSLPASGALEFAWGALAGFPRTMTLTLHAPAEASGDQDIVAWAEYRSSGSAMITLDQILRLEEAEPEGDCPSLTAARTLNLDHLLPDLPEGGEQMMMGEESVGGQIQTALANCVGIVDFHSGDPNKDWHITLTELLRVVQFFNAGGYHCADPPDSTEDGYVPQPGDQSCAPHDSDFIPLQPDWYIGLKELLRFIQFFNTPDGYSSAFTVENCEISEDGFLPGNIGARVAVKEIKRLDPNPIEDDNVRFSVEFTCPVDGVDASDFSLVAPVCEGHDAAITGIQTADDITYTVTVSIDAEYTCSVRLNVVDDNSIEDDGDNPLGGPAEGDGDYVSGESYTRDGDGPFIWMEGDPTVVLACSQGAYVDDGACACDIEDGPLQVATARVCDTGMGTQPRAYKLVYNATNTRGITATATRYVVECNGPIEFDDTDQVELERLIRAAADVPDGDIEPQDVMHITHLFAQDNQGTYTTAPGDTFPYRTQGITNLSGIEYCLDLRELYLFNELSIQGRWNNPSSLAPLSTLQSLERLDLTSNQISSADLATLAWGNLISLRWLKLSQNQIASIVPLAPLTWLESLNLESNLLSSYGDATQALAGVDWRDFTSLTRLNLAFNFLHTMDLGALTLIGRGDTYSEPYRLTWLDLHSNEISNIFSLEPITSLTHLNLHENHIADLTPLHYMTDLECLWLGGGNPIQDLSKLLDNAGLDAGDRISLWQNTQLDTPAAKAVMDTLEQQRGVFVWRPEAVETAAKKSSLPDYVGRIQLHYDEGVITLAQQDLYSGAYPAPRDTEGDQGRLRVLDQNGIEVVTPVSFRLTRDPCELEAANSPLQLTEADLWILVPLSGPIDLLEYLPLQGSPQILYDTRGQQKENTQPIYGETPGIPVPIYARLIHGDPAVPDESAYVLLVLGEAFTKDQLGSAGVDVQFPIDDDIPAATDNFSEAAADAIGYTLETLPFSQYRNHMKIYRVDFVSPEDQRVQPPECDEPQPGQGCDDQVIYGDTTFGLHRATSAVTWNESVLAERADQAAQAIGIDNIGRTVVIIHDDGFNANENLATCFVSKDDARRINGLHELGHGIGVLADEKSPRGIEDLKSSLTDRPNVIAIVSEEPAGQYHYWIPAREEIPWEHWLTNHCDTVYMGTEIEDPCPVQQTLGNCACCLGPATPNGNTCEIPVGCTPLPTCIPDGTSYNGPSGSVDWPEPDEITALVGLYEGALYYARGAYRPMLRCRMRSDFDNPSWGEDTREFCRPCREALVLRILEKSGTIKGISDVEDLESDDRTFTVYVHRPHSPTPDIEWDLKIEWKIDGNPVCWDAEPEGEGEGEGDPVCAKFITSETPEDYDVLVVDTSQFAPGTSHTVQVTVTDNNTTIVHPDAPSRDLLTESYTWNITMP